MSCEPLPIYCLSMSHKNAPVEIRRRFAFTQAQALALLQTACADFASGAVLVATCNRMELYFSAREAPSADRAAEDDVLLRAQTLIAASKGENLQDYRAFCVSYAGAQAVRHLFSVASGLDSMVLGENEILGQLRESYKRSCESSYADFYMNFIFQRALSCAKRVKTETNLSKTTESIATLAVKEIMSFRAQTCADRPEIAVLLIGASGQTGGLIVRDLAERSGVRVFATVRSSYPLPELPNVQKIGYDERFCYLDRADVVVSATKSPHCTIALSDTARALSSEKQRLFIDLAVPNDIEPGVKNIAGVTLKNIDCFTKIAAEHNLQKKRGVEEAYAILAEELDETVKELQFHGEIDFIQAFGKAVGAKSGLRFLYDMRSYATAEQLSVLLELWHSMYNEYVACDECRRSS